MHFMLGGKFFLHIGLMTDGLTHAVVVLELMKRPWTRCAGGAAA